METRVEGRYPAVGEMSTKLDPDAMTVRLTRYTNSVSVRIDDVQNPAMWIEVEISVDELKSLLKE